ncbi:family 20 glycosylhydrolase [uncultured Algibacter sp.]|uniref:beta-N-acetylhexosaminidase n=1 Tax=uncultured Algibacter sp. TaxID=298659 RepID=UPI0026351EB3|nr:family 20 glycosylhydrolase [uncultured Algibacter sp.]
MKNTIVTIIFISGMLLNAQNKLNETLNLMPWPNDITQNSSNFLINSSVTISIHGNDQGRVRNAAVNFLRRLADRTGVFIDEGFPISNTNGTIVISFDSVSDLSINTDESYELTVNDKNIQLHAKTDVGILRGLETLLQLTSNNATAYYFPGVTIKDAPRFVWRGLMIDVSRHFHPVDVIKRNLRAMASVKMNVFHWHLTDDQGFRAESKVYPKLHELASDGLFYTQDQIKDIVNYAANLGIRVIPEFDVPGHATAFLTAYPELGSKKDTQYVIERNSGIFDPTLNPTIDDTYVFLDKLFTEMAALFPDAYFHIGGDENEGKHWDENEDIQAFMVANNLETNHDLQTYFNIKLEKILKKSEKNLMGWDEIMTPNMPTTAVIHAWRGERQGLPKGGALISAAKAGYNTVLSNGFYIDLMYAVEDHYNNEPIGDIQLTTEERARILGGEATMWSELVTPRTIDSRIWPRTAAIAERLWSKKEVNDVENMKLRLKDISYKLEELGITHIKNKDAILRGMTNNQDITALVDLSKICEPLKTYTRNEGGTEYKTYSPFTLFADACGTDAEDAFVFNKLVHQLTENVSNESLTPIVEYLKKWASNYAEFEKINNNPKVNALKPLSLNVSKASRLLLKSLQTKELSNEDRKDLNTSIKSLKEPCMDVELVIITSLEKLSQFSNKND